MYSTVVTNVCYWLTRNRLLHQAHLMSTLRQIFINNCLLGEGVMELRIMHICWYQKSNLFASFANSSILKVSGLLSGSIPASDSHSFTSCLMFLRELESIFLR